MSHWRKKYFSFRNSDSREKSIDRENWLTDWEKIYHGFVGWSRSIEGLAAKEEDSVKILGVA